ncbi:hypothetical protein I6N95_13960 [Vagococcus sp. BWB3-3]|uniref:Uncharacterized protein n=1 Tax=Vagococcus allomyrinae TaxID=2794353 RepID=A0A940SVA0_9ENTE|nr:hypothetical protein [Vagococcus allomyrinae]MBP1042120.1 hypothetical protein [Vagococcus allomyrinae]
MEEAKIMCLRCGNQEVALSRHEHGENYVLFGCDEKKALSPEITIAINVAICDKCGEVAFLKAKEVTEPIV